VRIQLIGLVLVFLFSNCSEQNEKIKAKRTKMTEFVYASVFVEPKGAYNVYASVNGVIDEVYVEENQSVVQGQTLARITNQIPLVNVEKAKLNTSLAEQNYSRQKDVLSTMKNDINSARRTLEIDSINFKRQERLWEQNIGSQSEYDSRKLNYDLARNNLTTLLEKYRITEKDLQNQMKTQIKLARNSLKSSEVNNQEFEIKSKIDGKVYAVYKNPGESVLMQEPIAKIGQRDTFIIEMEVDEVDIARISIGQLVLINLDAYEDNVFESKIDKIYPQKDIRTQTFLVEARFLNPPDILYPGLSGEANIVISEREDVLTIPLDYLFNGNTVLTESGEIDVLTGIKNMKRVEIISGIDSTTFIIKPE
jgi:multidrug efflux pump subunit AcrA (membrane-fusion protein)